MAAATLREIPSDINPVDLRYVGEKRKIEEIQKNESARILIAAVKKRLESEPAADARKVFLLSAVRLTPTMCPRVFDVLEKAFKTLRLDVKAEVYVQQSPLVNASCSPTTLGKNRPAIMLTSGMIEKLNDDEMLFTLGHEIGHMLFEHHAFSVPNIIQFPESRQYPFQSVQLMSWARACEISCDRIGLLACQNFEIAVRTFFKLASGLSDQHINVNVKEYWEQILEAQTVVGESAEDLGWYSTHPFNPYRIRALFYFLGWERLQGLWQGPRSKTSYNRDDLEQNVEGLLKEMDPDYLKSEQAAQNRINEFFAWAGTLVVGADGKFEQAETKRLYDFIGKDLFAMIDAEMRGGCSFDDAFKRMTNLSVPVHGKVSVNGRMQMIVNLLALAQADGNVGQAEMNVISQICMTIGIDPQCIPNLLASMKTGSSGGGTSNDAAWHR